MSTVTAKCYKGQLHFIHKNNYESRGLSIERLIRESVDKYNIEKKFNFTVWTGDVPQGRLLSFSTARKNYDKTFPCFVYDGWPEVGLLNYDQTVSSFVDTNPTCNKIGWIGAIVCDVRKKYMSEYADTYFTEAITNNWNHYKPDELWKNTSTFLSYQDQIDRWKYLLDIEGVGWSARTKVLLSSPRIVFIVDRPYEEWWYQYLEPWKHYVPVKRDLSNLQENYVKIENDVKLQQYIKTEQRAFAKMYLTKDAALKQIRCVISNL